MSPGAAAHAAQAWVSRNRTSQVWYPLRAGLVIALFAVGALVGGCRQDASTRDRVPYGARNPEAAEKQAPDIKPQARPATPQETLASPQLDKAPPDPPSEDLIRVMDSISGGAFEGILALGQIQDASDASHAVEFLRRLNDHHPEYATFTRLALARLGSSAERAELENLLQGSEAQQLEGVDALGYLGDRASVEQLLATALDMTSPRASVQVRTRAAWTAGQLIKDPPVPATKPVLDEEDLQLWKRWYAKSFTEYELGSCCGPQ